MLHYEAQFFPNSERRSLLPQPFWERLWDKMDRNPLPSRGSLPFMPQGGREESGRGMRNRMILSVLVSYYIEC